MHIGFLRRVITHESTKDVAIIFFFGIVIALAYTPFFLGKILYETDVAYYYLPAFKFYADTLHAHESVRMFPAVFSGFPLYLSQVGGFLDPINYILFKYISFPLSYHFRIALNYWLGALFTYLFVRSLGLGRGASAVAALTFIGSQNVFYGLNILRSNTFYLLPGLCYVLQKLSQKSSLKRALGYILLGACILGFSVLSGYTQLVLYSLFLVVAFGAYRYVQTRNIRFLGFAALTAAGAGLICAPYVLAVMTYLPFSSRAGALPWDVASASSITFDILGAWMASSVIPYPLLLHTSYIVGSIGLLCIPFVWFARKKPIVLFCSAATFLTFLCAYPYPFFWVLHQIPIFANFRYPIQWIIVTSFLLSVLAGIGFEQLCKRLRARFPTAHKTHVGIGVFGVVLLSAYFAGNALYIGYTESIPWEELVRTPKVIETITAHEAAENAHEPFRVHVVYGKDTLWYLLSQPFNPSKETLREANREYLEPHLTPALWGIESIDGFDNFVPNRYARVLAFFEEMKFIDAVVLPQTAYFSSEDMRLEVPSAQFYLLGMMNVKYVWTVIPFPESYAPGLELIGKTGVDGTSLRKGHEGTPYTMSIFVYKNKLVLPRVFSPSHVQFLRENGDPFDTIIHNQNDFTQIGYVECTSCGDGLLTAQTPPSITNIQTTTNTTTFQTNGSNDAWLFISNTFVPGWHAYIDGTETTIFYGNYIYQAINVPAGNHTVRMEYR